MAEIIQKNASSKLVALELQKPYPQEYQATVNKLLKKIFLQTGSLQ